MSFSPPGRNGEFAGQRYWEISPEWAGFKYSLVCPKTRTRWTLREWKKVMQRFQEKLQQDLEIVRFFREKSQEKY
ncbi:hypothetical protein GTO27_04790 [Candidatus Bathyarchaeota archaeon]|nr:hypothetical protein [Candidatus Bathyarchaeota archaeon]